MTRYVVFDKSENVYVEIIYKNSVATDSHRSEALECETIEEAKAILTMSLRRMSSSRKLVIRVTETTETEFDPDAPHTI